MREAKTYRDPYTDIKRTSAMSGPHRRKKSNVITSALLAIAIGLLLAMAMMAWALEPECTTDTECGCTTDCLEPAK